MILELVEEEVESFQGLVELDLPTVVVLLIIIHMVEVEEQAAVVVIECYAFRIADDSLLFHEMCAWMWERGFMAVDLCEPLNRPRDGCLWQVDVVFTPRTRPECATRSFA